MNFTPQQLAGGVRYGSKTRVGNWLEDVCLEETKFADFKRARAEGTLTMGMFNRKVAVCTQEVPHSFSEDGFLKWGDAVVLAHKATGGSLACDPFEAAGFESDEYNASVCESTSSMARNTFIIVPAELVDSEIVTWCTPFRLMANPSLRIDEKTGMLQPPLYLASDLKNERKASPMSNNQLVFMTAKSKYNSVWMAQMPAITKDSGADRMLSSGTAIPAGADIILKHCATRQLLCSSTKYPMATDFGNEFEVSGCTRTHTGKVSVMAGEFSGRRIGQTNVKPEQDTNIWAFVTSADPEAAVENRNLPEPISSSGLLKKVVDVISSKGTDLKSAFMAMDAAGDFKLDREDLKWGLRDLGIDFEDEQFSILFDAFDPGSDGIIDLNEFLGAVDALTPVEETPEVEDP